MLYRHLEDVYYLKCVNCLLKDVYQMLTYFPDEALIKRHLGDVCVLWDLPDCFRRLVCSALGYVKAY